MVGVLAGVLARSLQDAPRRVKLHFADGLSVTPQTAPALTPVSSDRDHSVISRSGSWPSASPRPT